MCLVIKTKSMLGLWYSYIDFQEMIIILDLQTILTPLWLLVLQLLHRRADSLAVKLE